MESRYQRELAFRMFDYKSQKYDKDLLPSAQVDDDGYFVFIADTAQYVVEQFTGMRDHTDTRKIFEGDLVKEIGNDRVLHVVMGNDSWELHSHDDSYKSFLSYVGKYEIVGTIHDKELWP